MTRVGLANAEDAPVRLVYRRPGETQGTFLSVGDVTAAQVDTMAPQLGGAFVTTPAGPALLRFPRSGRPKSLSEGAAVQVRIQTEAQGGKAAIARLHSDQPPGAMSAQDQWRAALGLTPAPDIADIVTGAEARVLADLAEEAALLRVHPIPGGGDVAVERTRAFIAVDVDAGERAGGRGDRARLAEALNAAACPVAARALCLAGWGGLIAVDFLAMARGSGRATVREALIAAFKSAGLAGEVEPLGKHCVAVTALPRTIRPVSEVLTGADGSRTDETLALGALRALEREGRANRGARLRFEVSQAIADWLAGAAFDWRAQMTLRLGPRFTLAVDGAAGRDHVVVSAH